MKLVAHSSSAAARKGTKAGHSPRKALARPGVLATAMFAVVAGAVYFAGAQNSNSASSAVKMSTTGSYNKPADIRDIPKLMRAYGQRRLASSSSRTAAGLRTANGYKLSGENLVEVDLTPNSPSDDREPSFSPNGDFICFVSNGADKNKDGKIDSINGENRYHLWVMNRDGSQQRRITGLYGDVSRNQRHPSWSPDGNRIVFEDQGVTATDGSVDNQLAIVEPFRDGDTATAGVQVALPEQITYFHGPKSGPAWSPTGSAIAFASNWNVKASPPVYAGQYDIFSISPDGTTSSLSRITGDPALDPGGSASDDIQPAYSPVNSNAIYFSSNRDNNGKLPSGVNRIWVVGSTGTDLRCVTNPLVRTDSTGAVIGSATDSDQNPSLSRSSDDLGITETLAFQTNSKTFYDDTAADGRDQNIWTVPVDSEQLVPDVVEPPTQKLVVSSYTGNQVLTFDPFNVSPLPVEPLQTITGGLFPLSHPEGVFIGDGSRLAYVSDRGNDQIDRFQIDTGATAGAKGVIGDATFTQAGSALTQPAGLVVSGKYLYACSGDAKNTTAIYRFDATTGAAAGYNAANQGTGIFSHGEGASKATGLVNGGCEGLVLGPDQNGDGLPDLYCGILGSASVNVYSQKDGTFLGIYVAPGDNNLSIPTGMAFDTDGTLYIGSAGTDEVFVYSPDSDVTTVPAVFQRKISNPSKFNKVYLNQPEEVALADLDGDGNKELYVSNFDGGFGFTISRFDAATGTAMPNIAGGADPTTADWLESFELDGVGHFAFDSLAKVGPVAPTPTPVPGTDPPVEGNVSASGTLITSAISSPQRFIDSGLAGANAIEDKAADINPSFARSVASALTITQIAFASGRKANPFPQSGTNPNPAIVNPYGGNELDSSGNKVSPAPPNDIWTTSARDTTPPALVPQGIGNNQFTPLIAPRDNSGLSYPSPQTAEGGLKAGGDLRVAFVLREEESGLDTSATSTAVTVSFRDTTPTYDAGFDSSQVNESIVVKTLDETAPHYVKDFTNMRLNVYDDGPCVADGSGGCLADSTDSSKRVGGHERQASAVKGDGDWYCESDPVTAPVKTPKTGGDYYIDINVQDRAGNAFLFDRVWGFSTTVFKPVTTPPTPHDLYVSDYAVGQDFPAILSGDSRFDDMPAVESYYLTNPGGLALVKNVVVAQSTPTTFDNVDVWRILCRGPIPQTTLASYEPSLTTQIDPNEKQPDGTPGPFLSTHKTRSVAVAKQCIIWHAPYAGTAFAGPGTIQDPDTQTRLTQFLEDGGRLFLSGREILYTLSNNGNVQNTFARNELQSDFGGENSAFGVTGLAGGRFTNFPADTIAATFNDLQFPDHTSASIHDSYLDGALTQDNSPGHPVSTKFDLMAEGNSDSSTVVIPAYADGGTPVGKRIEKTRKNGVQSRVVFFSFGFEAVNRAFTHTNAPLAVDMRVRMANAIRTYFKTGGVSGTVVNDRTNLPVTNFLIEVDGSGGPYYDRTDANGQFTVIGLPPGGYTVKPVYTPSVDPNNLFTGGTPQGAAVSGGAITGNVNFRVILPEPASVSGHAVQSNATPNNPKDDTNLPNTPVMIRSIKQSSIFTNNGRYAALTMTNAGGIFSFTGVPSGFDMEVIFNPNRSDFQTFDASTGTWTDIPGLEGLYANYLKNVYGGPNPAYGRRLIPDSKRPTVINLPPSNAYVLNDQNGTTPDTAADSGINIVVPLGPSVTGKVYLRDTSTPVKGAIVSVTPLAGGPTPDPVVTGPKGGYVFADVKAGKYTLKVDATIDGVRVTKSTSIVVKQGTDLTVPNVVLFLAQVSGTVTKAGKPAQGIVVTLQSSTGAALAFTRSSTTGPKGKYLLSNVPAGNYKVYAAGGGFSGSSPVTVTSSADATADIAVTRTGIYGNVFLNGALVQGAAVELLDSSGNSLSPAVTTTSDAQGLYGFSTFTSGSYKVKASIFGDSAIVGPVTGSPTGTKAPDLNLYVSRITGRVLFQDNSTASGVLVECFNNGVSLGTIRTDEKGNYSFRQLPAGTYTLTASFANTSGQAAATLVRGNGPVQAPDIILMPVQRDGTTFSKVGSYSITLPYEDSNSPTTNNSGVTPATVLAKNVFNLPMFDTTTGAQNYMLQKFNTTTLQYVSVNPTDTVKRGEGYLLRVLREASPGSAPLQMVLPGSTNSLRALQGTIKSFTLVLHRNPSITNSPNNGLNLIGSGLKPSLSNTGVKVEAVVNGSTVSYDSIQKAFEAGVLGSNLLYIDPDSGATVTNTTGFFDPYVGYYLRTNVDGVKVTLTAQ